VRSIRHRQVPIKYRLGTGLAVTRLITVGYWWPPEVSIRWRGVVKGDAIVRFKSVTVGFGWTASRHGPGMYGWQ
jgi:hypothetical protein